MGNVEEIEEQDRDQSHQVHRQRANPQGKPHEGHKDNFFRCIREGGLPVSDVYSHTQIMHTCHLAAIAARLGRKIKWDPKTEKITDDALATSMLGRKQREGFEIPKV